MKIYIKIFIVLVLASAYTVIGHTQKGWEVGCGIGAAHYFGDINTNYDITLPGPHVLGIVRYNFNKRTAVAGSISYGLLRGDDAKSDNTFQQVRNLHFRSHTFDMSAVYEFNFLPFLHDGSEDFISPYLFAGASVFRFTPKAKYQDEWVELAPLGTEGQSNGDEYYGLSGSYVFGFGLKYSMNPEWSWNLVLTVHKTMTDYLDDVSTTYPESSSLNSPAAIHLSNPSIPSERYPDIGQPGYQRGNNGDSDSFSFLSFNLTYYFSRIDCPNISDIY